jgi:type IV pilus assembly protein PilA
MPNLDMHRSATGREDGFSLVELLIVVGIILVIAALAIPSLLRSKISANEASAASSMRTLDAAEIEYNTTYGSFSPDLSSLGLSYGVTPTSTLADLVDQSLAPTGGTAIANKSGYVFSYTGSKNGFTLNASPAILNQSGVRYFYSDQSLVIRVNPSGVATPSSPPL